MLIIGVIFFIFIILLLLFLGLLRVYATIKWNFTDEDQQIIIMITILGFTILKKDVGIMKEDGTAFPNGMKMKDLNILRNFVIENVRCELLKTKTIIGTGEPDTTAILYSMLQSLFTMVSARLRENAVVDCQLSAHFDETIIQSNGRCMISWKLRKTMRVWKSWKTKGE
ncbi:hypothetical protein [Gracilibacillus xinjiangensis]|uniref:Uncharacterized protein n=1 Tax=Gracilibacillus xinjiangensis TaxID=1193282 RepID=A0ABV8WZT3_9BACI